MAKKKMKRARKSVDTKTGSYTLVMHRARNKKYYWTLESSNGRVLSTSQMYVREPSAVVRKLNRTLNRGGACTVCYDKSV